MSQFGNLRSKYPKTIFFIKMKLCDIVGNNVYTLSIAEIKLDSLFLNAQFLLLDFHKPLRLDINHRSGGLLVYTKASLPSKILTKFKLLINN